MIYDNQLCILYTFEYRSHWISSNIDILWDGTQLLMGHSCVVPSAWGRDAISRKSLGYGYVNFHSSWESTE